MSDVYSEILQKLKLKKRDFLFPPSLLDQLNEKERREIEFILVNCCLLGDESCYQYIPYLRYIDLFESFPISSMNGLSNLSKSKLISELYAVTHNNIYLNELLSLAKTEYYAYSKLTLLYDNIPSSNKIEVLTCLKSMADINDKYKLAFQTRIVNFDNIKLLNGANVVTTGLLGFAIADALGVPYEFKSREKLSEMSIDNMIGYGSHHVPAGTWSDDTSLTIAAMCSIIDNSGEIDYIDVMSKYCDWLNSANYTATDEVFDVGIGTRNALLKFEKDRISPVKCGSADFNNNGNGSLMRMLPVVYYLYFNNCNDSDATSIIKEYSSLTHGHEISHLGCNIYFDFMSYLLDGNTKEESLQHIINKDYSMYYSSEAINAYNRILDGSFKELSSDDISSSGYVVHTLEAALWSVFNTNSYESAVVTAVSFGDDTDTVAAVTGSLAATIYGLNSVPVRWIDKLQKKEYLVKIGDDFFSKVVKNSFLPIDCNSSKAI